MVVRRLLILVLVLSSGCMSMQTRKAIRSEEVAMHPELGDIMRAIARLEQQYENLSAQVEASQAKQRADLEVVLDQLQRQIETLQAEVKARR